MMNFGGWRIAVFLGLAAIVVAGCTAPTIPDPNDPKDAKPGDLVKVLRLDIQNANDSLDHRVQIGEISDKQRLDMLADIANKELTMVDPPNCAPRDAWVIADLLITARRYSEAIPVLQKAIDWAKSVDDDDRRVNDTLRLARCTAETGKIAESLDITQKLIASKPRDPGPVLPSVLLQIAPVTRGRGHDVELAKLLEESIHEHLLMKVNPSTDAGRAFIIARPFHINRAWRLIEDLYDQSGHHDEALAAAAKQIAMDKQILPPPPTQL